MVTGALYTVSAVSNVDYNTVQCSGMTKVSRMTRDYKLFSTVSQ